MNPPTLVAAQKSEELFLDYKQIVTGPDARALHDSDRKNLRKALSGFANSEGGVILWGPKTQKTNGVEVLEMPDGYSDVARFVSLLEDAVSGCTVPPVPGVRSIPIFLNEDCTKGIVATLIPASLTAPHQTTDDSRAYYMRAGSSFQHVPHGVLAGMFGQKPTAVLSIHHSVKECRYLEPYKDSTRVHVRFDLSLSNLSSVVANDAYISWNAKELGNQYSELVRVSMGDELWKSTQPTLKKGSMLAVEGHRLAPYSAYSVLELELGIFGEITEGIDVDIYYGCAGSPPYYYRHCITKSKLEEYVSELKKIDQGTFDPTSREKFLTLGKSILGIQSDR